MRLRRLRTPPPPPFPPAGQRPPTPKRRLLKGGLLLVLLIGIAALFAYYWYWQHGWIITTGRIVATQIRISSPLTGRITLISVREGEEVEQGQLLVKLDDTGLKAELTRAEIRLAQARSRLQAWQQMDLDPSLQIRVAAAQRDLDLAEERYRKALAMEEKADLLRKQAQKDKERAERLFLLRAITRAQWEQALLDWKTAQASYAAAQAERSEAEAAVQGARRLLAQAKAAIRHFRQQREKEAELLRLAVEEATAQVAEARSRLQQTVIYAPRSGRVLGIDRQVGEVVDPNDVILTLIDPQETWIEAYVSGAELSTLHDKQPVLFSIEGGRPQKYRGQIRLPSPPPSPLEHPLRVGPQRVRSPSRLPAFLYPVKIVFTDTLPPEIRPEMFVRIWIRRE
ncbi:MAG: HlyD family secretion protein [Nitrospinota bacterium]|nr:MAG: HlyD family secretion protein [Nitrospinota bacterium]